MKTRKVLQTLVLLFLATAASGASDPTLGNWKLSESKSRFSATAAKERTVVYRAEADQVKVAIDGTNPLGQPTHNDWTGSFDGKDYAVVGDAEADTRSYRKIDGRTTEFTNRKNGKVTTRGRIVVAADGKSCTVTGSGTDANGRKIKFTAVYEKSDE
jgi:hypothetical protein